MQGLAKFLEEGGTLMYVNLVVSIITLAIIIDRAIFFLGKGSVNAKAFLEQIRKLVLANNIDRAVKLCSATRPPWPRWRAPVCSVFTAANRDRAVDRRDARRRHAAAQEARAICGRSRTSRPSSASSERCSV